MTQIFFLHNNLEGVFSHQPLTEQQKIQFLSEIKKLIEQQITIYVLKLQDLHHQAELTVSIHYKTNEVEYEASFLINESSSSHWHLNCFDNLINLMLLFISNRNEHNALENFNKIICHEIIHAIDLFHLKENLQIYEQAFQKKKNGPLSIGFSTQWFVLSFLANIRNEGIAVLGSKLYGPPSMKSPASTNNVMQFQKDIQKLLQIVEPYHFYHRINNQEVLKEIEALKQRSYSYAQVISYLMLNMHFLDFSYVSLEDLIEKATEKEKAKYLKFLIDLDLSEWINLLLNISVNNQFLIDFNKILKHCSLVDKNKKSEIGKENCLHLLKYGYKKNEKAFLEIVKSHVPEKLSINQCHLLFETKKSQEIIHDIAIDINALSENLVKYHSYEQKELVEWSLSYYFSEKDMIWDQHPFLGLQDDWMVLEGATQLIVD